MSAAKKASPRARPDDWRIVEGTPPLPGFSGLRVREGPRTVAYFDGIGFDALENARICAGAKPVRRALEALLRARAKGDKAAEQKAAEDAKAVLQSVDNLMPQPKESTT